MTTTHPSRPALLLLLALAVPACGFLHTTFHHDGISYSDRDGVLFADDTPLRFERWVRVEQAVPAGTTLELYTSTGPITLSSGTEPGLCSIEAHLYSEVQNDGVLELAGGELKARSESGHKLAINGVRGTVPPGCALDLDSGTGAIGLRAITGGASLRISTGTADVTLEDCVLGELKVDTGTGDMALRDVRAASLGFETGTGTTHLVRCNGDDLDFESGTGTLHADECQFRSSTIASGTGDVELSHGTSLGQQSLDLGTGAVNVVGG